MKPNVSPFAIALAERFALGDSNILDVGCGDGSFVRELAARGAHATGIECSARQLESCGKATLVADERYVAGVAQALPFADGAFDATVLRFALHHVPIDMMGRALREARRVTRPDGELFVFEPLTSGSNFELTRLIDDETMVRAAAQAAIGRAVEDRWLSRSQGVTLLTEVVHADFPTLRQRLLAVDGTRAQKLAAIDAELRHAFDSLGTETRGGRRFVQPVRLDVLRWP